jgi:hypothetical protein
MYFIIEWIHGNQEIAKKEKRERKKGHFNDKK